MITNAFDLATLEQIDTATVTLLHPVTGEEIEGATVEVYGPDSAEYKAATTKMRARITDFIARNRGAKSEDKQRVFDGYERDRNIRCIKAVNGLKFKDEVITDPQDACDKFNFVYTQAVQAMDNQGNFIKDSSAK